MQFSAVTIVAASVAAVSAASVVTETDLQSTLVTITDCGPEVTDCPAKSSLAPHNHTATANVSSYEGAANKQYAAGAVALAAGALLAL
ncbi:hypothetical protein FT663_01549 [Candidozyma haemuli var. vulneris]|nr:hypothetical protein FT662_02127 [[Candida] haemuloni var. vulneris]KAF3994318.1 hypothetical protein FT663_01549 [[Candida] haemuloni var. vulneris]